MKKTLFAALSLSLFTGVLCAETINLNDPAAWGNSGKMKKEGETLVITGAGQYITTKTYPIDPQTTYLLSAEIRLAKDSPAVPFLMGFILFDKEGKTIPCREINTVPGTDTVLTAPAKKGDRQIQIQNGARWKTDANGLPAYNTDPSGKDLPNRTAEEDTVGIKEVKRSGSNWIVSLEKPVKVDYPAGTPVRMHSIGGFFYSSSDTPVSEWKTVGKPVKGINPKVSTNQWLPGKFWTGAASFQVMIMPNWNWGIKNSAVEVKNLKLDIDK